MREDVLIEFQRITGQDVAQYFSDLSTFFKAEYPIILQYYSGDSKEIDRKSFEGFEKLEERSKRILEVFALHKERLSQVKWFELLEVLEQCHHSLKSVRAINRWGRTSIAQFGNSSFKTIEYILKTNQTIEAVSKNIARDIDPTNDWYKIAYSNQLREDDYDLSGGKVLRLNLDQINDIFSISAIVDVINTTTIKGKDINKHFSFSNDDISIVEGEEQLLQSIELLINLKKGGNLDAAELGLQKELIVGGSRSLLNFPIINRQLNETFASDDSLKNFQITNYSNEQDNIQVEYVVYNRLNEVINDTNTL